MGQKFRKHGIRASHTAEVVLSDVRVPGQCVVGGRERLDQRLARVREGGRGGEQAAMKTFEASRPGVAAMAVGVARAAVDYATEYARTRVQFGRPVGQNQAGPARGYARRGRRRPPADLARRLDGWQGQAAGQRRGMMSAGRGKPSGYRTGHQIPRATNARLPGRAVAHDAKIFTDLRGHLEFSVIIGRAITGLTYGNLTRDNRLAYHVVIPSLMTARAFGPWELSAAYGRGPAHGVEAGSL
jgi:hypothetical protein